MKTLTECLHVCLHVEGRDHRATLDASQRTAQLSATMASSLRMKMTMAL